MATSPSPPSPDQPPSSDPPPPDPPLTSDPDVRLDLVVLRAPDVATTRAFYEALGLRFVDERVAVRTALGPPHVAATLAGGVVLEIYPGPPPGDSDRAGPAPRLGFAVADLAAVWAALGAVDGASVVIDPDGRAVHLRPR